MARRSIVGVAFAQRGAPAGRRPGASRHPLLVEERTQPRRHRHHPCARGPLSARCSISGRGCKVPVYATPFAAALLEAKRAGEPDAPKIPVNDRAARQPLQARAVRDRVRPGRAFDPGIERAGHPHAARHRAPYRRLEARPDAGARPADRRGQAARARRRGRARAGRRFHQRGARRPLARAKPTSRKSLERADRRGAAAASRSPPSPPTSRASARSPTRRAPPAARWWWSAAPWTASSRSRARPAISTACRNSAAWTSTAICRATRSWRSDRQPGRAARGAGAHRRRTSIPRSRSRAGDRVIFSSRTIPGNEKAVGRVINGLVDQGIEVITDRTHWSMSPAIRAATSCEMYRLDEAADRHPGARRGAASAEHAKLARAARRAEGRRAAATATWSGSRRGAPRSSTRCRPAGSTGTARCWSRAEASDRRRAPAAELRRHGRRVAIVLDRQGRARWPIRRSS